MSLNKKSFWAKITGLSDEELNSDNWDGAKFKKPAREVVSPSKQNSDKFLSIFESNNREQKQEQEQEQEQEEVDSKDKNLELWQEEQEGQLAIDVYQTSKEIIIQSAIAGVKIGDLDITIDNDIVTIRGERKNEKKTKDKDYFYQECYWGKFSRSVVLPCEIKKDKARATLKDGVLTIILPKTEVVGATKIKIKENNKA